MLLNLSKLIKFSGTETHPAAETQSIWLPAYAQLAQVFAEPSCSYIVTPNSAPFTGIRPSTGIIPSASFKWTKELSSINRDYPIWQLCLDNETFNHLPGLYLDQKDCVRLPGLCKNSCQRGPLSATQLNRRAVRCYSPGVLTGFHLENP
jgi:hypothetical protein